MDHVRGWVRVGVGCEQKGRCDVITAERVSEIVAALARASAKASTNERFTATGVEGEAGNMFEVELDLTMPQGLVAAGLCRDEGEAKQFIQRVLGGALLASVSEVSTPREGKLR